jgi:hypothetical protein
MVLDLNNLLIFAVVRFKVGGNYMLAANEWEFLGKLKNFMKFNFFIFNFLKISYQYCVDCI